MFTLEAPTPRNSRSLSSQKKKDGTQWRQQEDDLKEIQRAMQAENSSVTSQTQDVVLQQTPSEAPSRAKDVSTVLSTHDLV